MTEPVLSFQFPCLEQVSCDLTWYTAGKKHKNWDSSDPMIWEVEKMAWNLYRARKLFESHAPDTAETRLQHAPTQPFWNITGLMSLPLYYWYLNSRVYYRQKKTAEPNLEMKSTGNRKLQPWPPTFWVSKSYHCSLKACARKIKIYEASSYPKLQGEMGKECLNSRNEISRDGIFRVSCFLFFIMCFGFLKEARKEDL